MLHALKSLILLCLLAIPQAAFAQDRLPTLNIVQSGHSLTDDIRAPLTQFVRAQAMRGGRLDKATLPGSPMDWRWRNATDPDIRQPGVMAQYDVLVLTERVPLSRTFGPHKSPDWALRWTEHAWTSGQVRTVLYASWVDWTSGPGAANPHSDPEGNVPFRDRLPLEMARWQQIQDHVNANLPAGAPSVPMIPGPLIMAAAYDEIAAGTAPGMGAISDLFADHIHLNPMGAYLIALAHFAVIYDADPRGLPHGVPARGGPDAQQAAWMQDLVWRVLQQTRSDR